MVSISDVEVITEMGTPFDDPKADIIVRSSDNVDFRMHKAVLSLVSPVWETMLTLPQNEGDANEKKDGLPIVRLPENGDTLRLLLSLCHPRTASAMPPTEIGKCQSLLEVTKKYEVEVAVEHVAHVLVWQETLKTDPFLVWFIATQFDMEEEMKKAAEGTLRIPLSQLISSDRPELQLVSGLQICRLMKHRHRCSEAAKNSYVLDSALDDFRYGSDKYRAPFNTWCTEFAVKGCDQRHLRDLEVVRDQVELAGPEFPDGGDFRESYRHWPISGNKWAGNYVEKVIERFSETPTGETAVDEQIMDDAVLGSGRCNTCAKRGMGSLREFGKAWAAAIDKAVAQVSY